MEYVVQAIDELIRVAKAKKLDLAQHNGDFFCYNGQYWEKILPASFHTFLRNATSRFGVPKDLSRYVKFQEKIRDQFKDIADFPFVQNDGTIRINLKSGTLQFHDGQEPVLLPFDKQHGLCYQLDYDYNPDDVAFHQKNPHEFILLVMQSSSAGNCCYKADGCGTSLPDIMANRYLFSGHFKNELRKKGVDVLYVMGTGENYNGRWWHDPVHCIIDNDGKIRETNVFDYFKEPCQCMDEYGNPSLFRNRGNATFSRTRASEDQQMKWLQHNRHGLYT